VHRGGAVAEPGEHRVDVEFVSHARTLLRSQSR
jgi:hypothetical protein